MRLTTRAKVVVGGIALLGAVALGGSAFTGTGVKNNAGATKFVGGSVTQTVTGATLSSTAYGFLDAPANTVLNSVTLTFTDFTGGKTPTMEIAGTPTGAVGVTCSAISATFVSVCTPATTWTDVTAVTITVI